MQKGLFGFLIFIIILGVSCFVVWKVFGNKITELANNIKNKTQNTTQQDTTVDPSGEYSINELFTLNKPLKCTWKENLTGEKELTNILYINDKKFYQDVTMGDLGHSFALSNGEYLYIWNDFNDAASKMQIPKTEEKATTTSTVTEQKKDFVCERWTVDSSLFNPPQNKNFKDVTEEAQGLEDDLKDNAASYKQQICDLCNQSPTQEIKNQCLENAECP